MMTNKTVIELSGRETQLMVELGEYAEILHWGNKVQGSLKALALHCIVRCHMVALILMLR